MSRGDAMPITIEDTKFELIGEAALDERKRITLSKAVELLKKHFGPVDRLHFTIHYNRAGQILLVPETTMPLHEVWLYRNPTALKSVSAGIQQAELGELRDRGSFVQYADDAIE